MSLLRDAILKKNNERPPVWFMRQAGRYHAHYQALRRKHSFMDLCTVPELACEVTLGPIDDFNFDAAILFSDILFPLDALGMGLSYPDTGPRLEWLLRSADDLDHLGGGRDLAIHMQFQADALKLIRKKLPASKGLLGFVGAPLTMYVYAVEGSHKGSLESAKAGFTDGRYESFSMRISDLMAENMAMQARAGADAVALFDTCAGEFDPDTYGTLVVPVLKDVMSEFKRICPKTPIIYYSKKTTHEHWEKLDGLPISCLGVDWHTPLADVLSHWGEKYSIQGNIDPHWLFLDSKDLEKKLRGVFSQVKELSDTKRYGWVCGLGHGVLPKTPEDNVRLFIKIQREMFG